MSTKVTLRQKKISKGRKSLYLDFYPAIPHPKTGKPSRREFLGLYLYEKAKSPIDKQHNTETQRIAESIRQKRENFLNKPEIYSEYEKEQLRIKEVSELNFVAYFKKLAHKRKNSNHANWVSALNYLDNYTKGVLKFADLNDEFLEGFKEHLQTTKSLSRTKTTLSQNTAVSYFNKIKAALRQAYKDGYLKTDLNARIEPIKEAETRREYLTLEELNKLVKTPCNNPVMKQAALFSALTGLRFSDIAKMKWNELEYIEGQGYFLNFSQKKTKGVEVLPISEQAYSLLGEPRAPESQVFKGLKYSAYHNKHLFQWIGAAGITKDITFHCFRHTYATLQLFSGTDIYTVSKMLGHKDLKTTQVYAKIVDEAKRTAANKIKLDM
ncbi:site-specific integrase [Leeuwenhoekiella marinoflava]|uniref:Site-specific recombinase XerC n=2 Tax=Leeuwenhoekiella marinoflava TaxID=988 RepID=A0A4Q0P5E0_9FLAO|nr:site-specific integrase [Leeuwenhoekiella marinoflava]RXG21246.1 site-specific recombinase XerC [Leeuwenhoekiella marinoflava]SHG05020.1 Site-specific recombinase XerC [Leeuwenhoekiella marinoflava DSM 3653]